MALAPIIAALPVVVGLVLLAGLRWPASRAMPACGAVTAVLALFLWQVPAVRLAAAAVEAVVTTASILLILFGALLLSGQLRAAGALATLQGWIGALSEDRRVQVVLVAWLMGSFFEGAAGFGTPAALTGPLLVSLGFPPLQAVVLALIGDSVAVVFGAVGTPILVGLGEVLGPEPSVPTAAAVGVRAATFDLLSGTLMPLLLVLTLTMGTLGRRGLRGGLECAPFALAIGFVHTSVAWLTASVLGPELPSLVGPLAALFVAYVLLRKKWLLPRNVWRLPEDGARGGTGQSEEASPRALLRSAAPYLLLITLLVLTRVRGLPLGAWLRSVEPGWRDLFGTGIDATIRPLYSPGLLLALVAALVVPWFRLRAHTFVTSAGEAGRVVLGASVPLVAAVATVRVFVHSGVNAANLQAMPVVLATVAASHIGSLWPLVAPWLGALGSFIAGSATFSNLLFGGVQLGVAEARGLSPVTVLALQTMGAAAGNMVCIHNVVAATAVVKLTGVEGEVIRRTVVPMAVYLLVAGALGLAFG
ncbi:MAG TPA: L-lactate permease [Myxococcaceae bacterium]|nr:L-lactate permease [Myxococcaceae bacterium]